MSDRGVGASASRRRTVGVVGAGTMGAGIAQVALAAGHEVLLHDVDPNAVGAARARVADGLARLEAKGALSAQERVRALGRLRLVARLEELAADSDLVVEAAPEELELKRSIFATLDRTAAPEAILSTNTSALSVSAIAEAAERKPGRVVGLHFFNPAPVMALVEVVMAVRSELPVIDRAVAFARELGKEPVLCRDAPGFIVNRVIRPFTLEALRIVEEGGATVTAVDAALVAAGFPLGPFALMDLVGIDVNYAVTGILHQAFGGEPRFAPSPIQERLVAARRLGRKVGRGFYLYDDGRPTGPAPEFAGPDERDLRVSDERIVERVVLAIINEAHHAVGGGVAPRSDVDRALRLGAAHPWGPFEWTERLGGPSEVRRLLERLASTEGARFRPAPLLLAETGG